MCPKIATPKRTKSAEQALTSLMALCARAERSSGDAKRLMTRWGVEHEAQESVLERLKKERFIDDERYAAAYVREKSRLNGWGLYKIRNGLISKGISREIIEQACSSLDSAAMRERLIEKVTKRSHTVKYTTPYQLRDKLTRYCASLGYSFDIVTEVVSEVIAERIDDEDVVF